MSPSLPLRTLIVDDEPMARAHLRALLAARDDVEIVDEVGDGRTAVERILRDSPDLVLLDIQMPELDGLSVVREVGAERMPAVIFVTAYDEHALAAFEVHALDYLLKPVNRERFADAVSRVAGLVRSGASEGRREVLRELLQRLEDDRPEATRIAIRVDGRVVLLRTADIDWVEASDDHVRFHVGSTVYLHRDTLTRLEKRLPASRFMRVHRSTIVNVDRIREMQPWFQSDWVIILADGTRLPSGRRYREAIRAYLARTS